MFASCSSLEKIPTKLLILVIIFINTLLFIYFVKSPSSIFKEPPQIELKVEVEEERREAELQENIDLAKAGEHYLNEEILIWYDDRKLMNWW